MTACTICGAPTAGTDLDDEAVCLPCYTANLAGAELRPLAWVSRERRLPAYARVLAAREEGRR